ncbi:hypothetical protein E4U55_002437 [Claviceps digitariae]|nr:hypothetical protein E4U55_002437 [Claviceps digitariae]
MLSDSKIILALSEWNGGAHSPDGERCHVDSLPVGTLALTLAAAGSFLDTAGWSHRSLVLTKASSMESPGSTIALLILGVLALCGIVYWFLKVQVDKYVHALFRYRRKLARAREANAAENTESSESA